jgi:uncharacterized membrane protein
MGSRSKTKTLVIAGMLAALILLCTYYAKFPIPKAPGAYVNIGDSIIYITSLMLGVPWAAGAAAVGSMFADLLYGGSWYIPATFVIKGLMGLVCSLLLHKSRPKGQEATLKQMADKQDLNNNKNWPFIKFILVCILGGAIMVTGYFAFEWAVFGWGYAIGTVLYNLVQWVVGVVIAAMLYFPVKIVKAAVYG